MAMFLAHWSWMGMIKQSELHCALNASVSDAVAVHAVSSVALTPENMSADGLSYNDFLVALKLDPVAKQLGGCPQTPA